MVTSTIRLTVPRSSWPPSGTAEQQVSAFGKRCRSGDEDYTRLLALGYLHRGLLVTDDHLETVERELAAFAQAEGFSMGFTYVEQPGAWPAAFEALIEAVSRFEVTAVVLPSLLHFAALGVPTDIRDSFERATGTRVLVAQPPP